MLQEIVLETFLRINFLYFEYNGASIANTFLSMQEKAPGVGEMGWTCLVD